MALHERGPVRAGVVLAMVLLAGCGGGKAPAKKAADASPTATAEVTDSPTPDSTALDLATQVGQVVVTSDAESTACADASSGTTSVPVDATPTEDTGISDTTGATSDGDTAKDVEILPGGRLLITCSSGLVLVYDIAAQSTLWSRASQAGDTVHEQLLVGSDHLFVVTTTDTAAQGLAASYISLTLTAVDLVTGAEKWTQPLEEAVGKDSRESGSVTLVEGPGRDPAHPQQVVVTNVRESAFDATTGAPLWTHDPVSRSPYVGYGLNIDFEGSTWAATDAKTGKAVWTQPVPEDGTTPYLDGSTLYRLADDSILEADVKTGRLTLNRVFPTEWSQHLVTPQLSLIYDGKNLQLYNTSNVRAPLWSAPGDSVEPVAVTRSLVVVKAESGLNVLDGKTGEPRNDVTLPEGFPESNPQVVDGLIQLSGVGVFELSPPTTKGSK